MPRLIGKIPAYRRHKATGKAVVTLSGKTYYLGPWKSAASKAEYKRVTREWLAAGESIGPESAAGLTIVELLAAFLRHVKVFHRDAATGKINREGLNYVTLIGRLNPIYGETLAREFGQLRLKAFRETLIEAGLARGNVNHTINRLRHIFKWGVENELVPPSVVEALRCVAGLRYGKTEARESEPVKPVPDAFVDAVLSYVSPQVKAMLELQRVTGMRSGEVCQMRMADIATSGEVWTYTPARHKTMYRGHSRIVYIGPLGQAILRPWLRTELESYLFSPEEAEAARRQAQHAARKTPLSCGNKPGSNVKKKPRKAPGNHYTTASYLRAVKYGLKRCNAERLKREEAPVPNWHPHQLRHNAATYFRKQHGLEIARVLLGHKHAAITETYAEADAARAVEVVAKIG